ncbi:MAG: DegT/DnrJ/EryC1/StrS family aminotransferase [Candidatus Omnitrophica bacterium]|nr:DegT/DnrJ/EryC1/StrS family aminotransferase [Candidatus Omnitrophota bacterium]
MTTVYLKGISQALNLLKARAKKYKRALIKITFDDFAEENVLFIDEIADELEKALKLRDLCEFEVYRKEFEAQSSDYFACPYALATSSGTAALSFSLTALGVGPGDQVITTPHTYIATALSISDIGAVPVFADIGKDFNIDPAEIGKKISPRVKAILPVHLYGLPCRIKEICVLAKKHGIRVVEDCCQAQGASFEGRPVGSFGEAGCFSFHPTKIVSGLGDGGMIITSETAVVKKVEKLREAFFNDKETLKSLKTPASLDVVHIPFLKVKLRHIDEILEKKRSLAGVYSSLLAGIPEIVLPRPESNVASSFRNYTIMAENRGGLLRHLLSKGIEAKIFYDIPLHLRREFLHLGYRKGDFPVCERIYEEIISLPISYALKPEKAAEIAEEIRRFYETLRAHKLAN